MKPLTLAGAVVTALGLLALFMSGIPYKSRKEVPSHSKTHLTIHQDKMLSVPPAAAGAIILLGVGLLILSSRR